MQEIWRWSNLGLAFLGELAGLGIFAWWGWQTGGGTAVRLLLAIGLPVIAAVVWGLLAAPTANSNMMLTVTVKVAYFGLAGLALWSLDHRILGIAFVVVIAANALLVHTGHLMPNPPTASHSGAVRANQA